MRIVSLIPSATEIVCALGARSELVGVSHECDFPPDVRRLPALTRPKIPLDGASAAIDRSVRGLVARGLGVYDIDVPRLAALAPDVIVTQQQCEVCAVSYADVERAARDVLGPGTAIVSLAPNALDDVWRDVGAVGAALGRASQAAALVARLRRQLDDVAAAVADTERAVTACIEWLDPLMLAGNWIPELVAVAGGSYPFGVAGEASHVVEWDVLLSAEPAVAVVMPCGFGIEQTRRELAALTARTEWRALPAVRAHRAAIVDGNAYLNRPGPRLVESAAILARLIHPEVDAGPLPPASFEYVAP